MVDFPANHVSFYWRVLYMLKNNHLNDVMVCKYCSHNHETVDWLEITWICCLQTSQWLAAFLSINHITMKLERLFFKFPIDKSSVIRVYSTWVSFLSPIAACSSAPLELGRHLPHEPGMVPRGSNVTRELRYPTFKTSNSFKITKQKERDGVVQFEVLSLVHFDMEK